MPVFAVAYDNHCFRVYKKKGFTFTIGIFVFTFTVKRFHIYGALLHLALKVLTLTGPYCIFTFRGETGSSSVAFKEQSSWTDKYAHYYYIAWQL